LVHQHSTLQRDWNLLDLREHRDTVRWHSMEEV
jgi:hypothetical protein